MGLELGGPWQNRQGYKVSLKKGHSSSKLNDKSIPNQSLKDRRRAFQAENKTRLTVEAENETTNILDIHKTRVYKSLIYHRANTYETTTLVKK